MKIERKDSDKVNVATQLQDFRVKRNALAADLTADEQEFATLKTQLADLQVERLFNPKDADAKTAKLAPRLGVIRERLSAKRTELDALNGAITRLEAEAPATAHKEQLAVQADLRQRYGAALKRVLDALAEVEAASELARTIHLEAYRAIPDHVKHEGMDPVHRHAGCHQAWPPGFVSDGINPTQRERSATFILKQYPAATEFLAPDDPARKAIEAEQRGLREAWERDERWKREREAAEARYRAEQEAAKRADALSLGGGWGARGELVRE